MSSQYSFNTFFDHDYDDENFESDIYDDDRSFDEDDTDPQDELAEATEGYVTLRDISAVKYRLRRSKMPLLVALGKVGVLADHLSDDALTAVRDVLENHGYTQCPNTGKWSHPRRSRRKKPESSK
jgi:hypothetical protein